MRPIGILRCRFEDNIKMDCKEIGWGGGRGRDYLSEDRDK